MYCEYSTKLEVDENGRNYLNCTIINDICPYIRYCPTIRNIKNIDNYKDCKNYKEQERLLIMADNKNSVRFEKNGRLYVDLNNDEVVIVKNPYDYTPKSVELIKVKEEYFVKGFEPKPIKPMDKKNEEKRN
jgi:hypothetical protein